MLTGGTKQDEYWRTIEMLQEKTGKSQEEVMYMLYFLYDSGYDSKDLKAMADLLHKNLKVRGFL